MELSIGTSVAIDYHIYNFNKGSKLRYKYIYTTTDFYLIWHQ